MKALSKISLIFVIAAIFIEDKTSQAQSYKIYSYDSIQEKSQLRVGVRYSSDYVYMGRSDSVKAPYLSPSIGYYHKSGFFLRSSVSYLTAKEEARIDMVNITGGYDFYLNDLTIGGSISQYFFSDLSYNVMAEMSTYVNAYVGYDFSIFTLYGDASLGFSGSTDVFAGIELSRTFYGIRNKLLITPSVYMNAGSQQYYNAYYANRSTQTGNGGKGKGKGSQTPVAPNQSYQVEESDQFKILDYEAGINVTYKIKNIRVFATSTWVFPVNPATLANDQGEYMEELQNGFYWSSGIRLIF
jgi:hypothetical protein